MAGKTVAEHLAGVKAAREAAQERMNVVAQKSMDEGRSMNEAEQAEFDAIEGEIKNLDSDIARYTKLEAMQAKAAKPVIDDAESKSNARANGDGRIFVPAEVKTKEKLEPGIGLARYTICLTKARGNHAIAATLAERHYPNSEAVVRTLKAQAEGFDLSAAFQTKATVAAGTTTNGTWAAPLVDAATFSGDFIEFLRARTLIGQAEFRAVPFNVRIAGQTSGGSGYWVGQGKAKPVTKFDYNATTIPYTKVAAIAVITQELARFSDPSAERLVRDSLADAVIAKIDSDLFDPDVAAVSGVNPAGLLNGVNPVAGPASLDPDDIRCALARLWAPWDASFMGARPAYYTTPAVARMLAFARDALGNRAFTGMTPQGGTLDGVPVRVSQYLANNGGSGGAPFILVDEAEIYLADDGAVTLDASEQASIEMADDPSGDSTAPTGASLVSMWQTNSIAFRAERFVWWGPRRSGAVQWIDGFPTSC
jgi:HK97 family phage major capsid protein